MGSIVLIALLHLLGNSDQIPYMESNYPADTQDDATCGAANPVHQTKASPYLSLSLYIYMGMCQIGSQSVPNPNASTTGSINSVCFRQASRPMFSLFMWLAYMIHGTWRIIIGTLSVGLFMFSLKSNSSGFDFPGNCSSPIENFTFERADTSPIHKQTDFHHTEHLHCVGVVLL